MGEGITRRSARLLQDTRMYSPCIFVLGDIDFVVLAKSPSREAFMKFLESMINSPEIERTSTLVVVKVIKEDLSLNI